MYNYKIFINVVKTKSYKSPHQTYVAWNLTVKYVITMP